MAAASKRVEQMRKARDRRARMTLVVLGIVAVAVAALQGPKLLKSLHSSSSSSTSRAVTTAGSPSSTASVAASATAGGRLADTAVHTSVGPGQLASFTLFESKDPFAQQVNPNTSAATSSAASTATSAPPAPAPAPRPVRSGPPLVVQVGKSSSAATPVAPGVVVSMNGVRERIVVGDGFPSGDPIFRLVSFKGGKARIGLTSGTFKDGSRAIVLGRGKSIVLLDVTTGVKFRLRLVSWSRAT